MQTSETPKKGIYSTYETIGIGGENQVMEAQLNFNHERGTGHITVKITTKMLAYKPDINAGTAQVAARMIVDRMTHFEELRKEWHRENDGYDPDQLELFPEEGDVETSDTLSAGFTDPDEKPKRSRKSNAVAIEENQN